LGFALWKAGRRAAALRFLKQAQQRHPADFWINFELGTQLSEEGASADAVGFIRVALAFRPHSPVVLSNLACALARQGKLEEAMDIFHQVIDLKADFPEVYYNLGKTLQEQKKLAEAVDAYRQAVARRPNFPEAYFNLAVALQLLGKLNEAAEAYRKHNAGMPNNANGPYYLGKVLSDQGDLEGAVAAFRQAIACKSDFAEAHCNLGQLLKRQGRFAEARDELKRGHALGSRNPGWRYPSAEWLREAERLVGLDTKLPQLLKGEAKPANAAECLEIAVLCGHYKKLPVAAVRFFQDAFADQPGLADDLRTRHRYNAACYAALAGCGQGKDADPLDAQEGARLRNQALDWLRADLTAWRTCWRRTRTRRPPSWGRECSTGWATRTSTACVERRPWRNCPKPSAPTGSGCGKRSRPCGSGLCRRRSKIAQGCGSAASSAL
jgi:tetratricopeptide (TPR) repeat protein